MDADVCVGMGASRGGSVNGRVSLDAEVCAGNGLRVLSVLNGMTRSGSRGCLRGSDGDTGICERACIGSGTETGSITLPRCGCGPGGCATCRPTGTFASGTFLIEGTADAGLTCFGADVCAGIGARRAGDAVGRGVLGAEVCAGKGAITGVPLLVG